MYDLAKRSLAFTVATGGLLLTGTAYTPALAATGVGANQGPAQAQGVQNDASASSVTAGSAGGAEGRAAQAPPDLLAPSALHPDAPAPKPKAATSGSGAAATSSTKSSGGILSGNNIQIPVDIGLDLCGETVKGAAVGDVSGGGHCSNPSGSSATNTTSHSGGIGSGNSIQVPVTVPIVACDDNVLAAAANNTARGADCGPTGSRSGASSGGSAASQTTDHSGGILSGNIVQAPVNVPINACGNNVNAAVVSSSETGSSCTNSAEGSAPTMPGAPAPGSGGASATAASVDNGGIGSGMIVQTPINVPLNVCGTTANAAAAHDAVSGGTCANGGGSATAVAGSNGNGGLVSGNAVQTPIDVPANVCGTEALAATSRVANQGTTCTSAAPGGDTPPGSTAILVSSNNGGIGSGNSAQTPINVPVDACGTNASVAGVKSVQAGPTCVNNTKVSVVTLTSHNGGVGSGNNVPVPVNVPVNVCGLNAAAVEGPSSGVRCTNVTHVPPTSPTSPPPTKPCPPRHSPTPPPPTKPCPPRHTPTPPPPTKPCPPRHTPTPPPPTKPCPPTTPPTTPTTPPTSPTTKPPTQPPTTPPTTPWTPPTTPWTPPHHTSPPPPPHHGGGLAHTGADIGIALGVAGAALLGGFGLRAAARRREGEE